MKFKVISIVGARPNFVKAAPVSKALKAEGSFEEVIVHTGQHYDHQLSQSFFEELEIPLPKYNLGIGSGGQAWQLGNMVAEIGKVLEKEQPDAVIVFGDTNSTAAGAIAAAKCFVPVAHVEAGLREFNKSIPEEVNKLLTDAVTDLYFCPTQTGVDNLNKVGISENVYLVGDVGIDLIYNNKEKIESNTALLEHLNIRPGEYYFLTCHRASNTDYRKNLSEILEAVKEMELPVIWPIHPRTKKAIFENGLIMPDEYPHVKLLPPIGFFDVQTLIYFAKTVVTDSGGVVKEAYFHKTPGLIMQHQIEWLETVSEGWNQLVAPHKSAILSALANITPPQNHSDCLGDGTASQQIARILKDYLASEKNCNYDSG